MYPKGLENSMEVAETSEWFDWMRTEIVEGGLNLPNSETSVLFAAKALQLAARIQGIYRHLGPLKPSLVKAAIVYQCWEWEKYIQKKAAWPGARRRGSLRSLDAVRYIRRLDDSQDHHLVEASDGAEYVVTVSTQPWSSGDTTPATEVLCNEMARLLGLRVADVAAVTLGPALLKAAFNGDMERTRHGRGREPELCCGFRHLVAAQGSSDFGVTHGRIGRRESRQLIGALVLDIWTLNLSPRAWVWAVSGTTGHFESTLVDDHRCLMGSNWGEFLKADFTALPGPQGMAARVKGWEQLDPWLVKIRLMDLNRLWELAFQMPCEWYAYDRRGLCALLNKLWDRQFHLRQSVQHFIKVGYLVNLGTPHAAVAVTANSESPDAKRCA